jgi:uncharacterized phage-associated protein
MNRRQLNKGKQARGVSCAIFATFSLLVALGRKLLTEFRSLKERAGYPFYGFSLSRSGGISMTFNVRKAAQVIAFLARERGGSVNYITAVKLAYLADRRFLELYDLPILNDDLVSMEHGPVDSQTYDFIKGKGPKHLRRRWERYVLTKKKENLVELTRKLSDDDFTELSEAEVEVLKETSKEYERFKNPWDLIDWIHKNCTEWENVGKTSKHLPYERVLNAIGKKNANDLTDRIFEFRNLQSAHSGVR